MLAAALAVLPLHAQEKRDVKTRAAVEQILRLASSSTAAKSSEIAKLIAAMGLPVAPVVLDLYVHPVLDAEWGAEATPLDALQQQCIAEAIELLGPDPLRPLVRERAAQNPPLEEQHALVEVVALFGESQDLVLLIEIAAPLAQDPGRHERVRWDFRGSAKTLIWRDPPDKSWMEDLILRSNPEVRESLVEALAECRSASAIELFADLLGNFQALDGLLLKRIWLLAQNAEAPPEEWTLAKIRPYLFSDKEEQVVDAIYAVGFLHDFGSVEPLIHFLADRSEDVQRSAHEALVRMTGLTFAPEQGRWKTWHAEELAWFEMNAPRLFDVLEHGDAGQVIDALLEIEKHSMFRDLLAANVIPVLLSDNDDVRIMACVILGDLGSKTAVTALVERLGDTNDLVMNAAWEALKKITRLDLPADYMAWKNALEAQSIKLW